MPRPAGSKNKATLLKEAEIAKALKSCEGHAALSAPKIVLAMAAKAEKGDVAAAKLILDRVYPAMRQVDDRSSNRSTAIQINIIGETHGENEYPRAGKTVDVRTITAGGESATEAVGGEVEPEYAGKKGDRTH